MIEVGNSIPLIDITTIFNGEKLNTTTADLLENKKVVLFAVPGAFTPTCSRSHLPGYITNLQNFREHGVDMIACLSVNDYFVMQAWAQDQHAESIVMIADGSAILSHALGLEMDTTNFGGTRSQRYAMIIENGVVTHFNLEAPSEFEVSNAETILALL